MPQDRMKKNVVQDVIPPQRSIRNVDLPSRRTKSAPREEIIQSIAEVRSRVKTSTPVTATDSARVRPITRVEPDIESAHTVPPEQPPRPPYKYEYEAPSHSSKKGLFFAIAVFVLAAAFGVSALFRGATVKVEPKHQSIPFTQTLTAQKDATGTEFGFQLVSTTKSVDQNVESQGERQVSVKARGQIVIYNTYSTQSQDLVATTRFQTPEGLIYRLVSPVTVPGTKTVSGKNVAGSVEATVEADAAGQNYNIGLKDFTIPGLKGTPKYTAIYARSKTPMSGGFVGLQRVVASSTVASVEKDLEADLKEQLAHDIVSQIPADFILYPTSLSYSFDPVIQANGTATTTMLRKSGTVTAVIFDKGALSRTLIAGIAPTAANEPAKVVNLEDFTFAYAATSTNPRTATALKFTLSGTANMVWTFDENRLVADLLGLSKTQANQIISTYPSIQQAWVETRPFWSKSIPSDPKKVTLINTLDAQ